jgi:hypothetical protein
MGCVGTLEVRSVRHGRCPQQVDFCQHLRGQRFGGQFAAAELPRWFHAGVAGGAPPALKATSPFERVI